MIDLEQYERILNNGLLLDHYLVLVHLKEGKELSKSKRVNGFINLLVKKGYIEDGALSEKGMVFLAEGDVIQPLISSSVDKKDVVDFGLWVDQLHRRLQDKLVELTGNKQVRDKIDKKTYPFLPNPTDLGRTVYKAIVLYKLTDLVKIEKCLMLHIEKCHRAHSWFPLMKYYIMKNGASDMITDMENIDDEEVVTTGKSNQKFV